MASAHDEVMSRSIVDFYRSAKPNVGVGWWENQFAGSTHFAWARAAAAGSSSGRGDVAASRRAAGSHYSAARRAGSLLDGAGTRHGGIRARALLVLGGVRNTPGSRQALAFVIARASDDGRSLPCLARKGRTWPASAPGLTWMRPVLARCPDMAASQSSSRAASRRGAASGTEAAAVTRLTADPPGPSDGRAIAATPPPSGRRLRDDRAVPLQRRASHGPADNIRTRQRTHLPDAGLHSPPGQNAR